LSPTAVIVLLICICAGAALFFSVNAYALRTFSRVKLLDAFKRTNAPDRPEERAERMVNDSEKLILSCSLYQLIFGTCILLLLLRLFANIRGGVIQPVDYLLTFLIGAAIFSVFSLAVPHAWAKYAGEKILCKTHRLLGFFAAVARPVVWMLGFCDGLVKRLAGVTDTTPEEQQEEKQEEFLDDLEQQKIEGVVDEEEQEMIENVLELSDTSAGQIMTPRTDIVAIEVNSDLNSVLTTVTEAGHSRFPVYQENIDNIIGMIYAKDLLTEIGADPADFKLRDKLRQAYFVPETKPLRVLLHEFQSRKLHIAVVLDEYGGTAGIVTLEDILEELVGEIADEYEQTPAEHIRRIDQDTIEVDARTYIDDLNDEFELGLPEDEDYETIGGFVFSHLGYIPKTGEGFEHNGLKFTITSAEDRRIRRIRIRKAAEQKNAD